MTSGRSELRERALALIDRLADGGRDDDARDALIADLARHQAEHVAPYGRLARRRPGELVAMPTDVFRFARVAAHPAAQDARVFRTSGTTAAPGQHALRDLALYDRAARAAARAALFPDVVRMALVVLAPHERDAPASSLSYMLSRFEPWFGRTTTWAFRDGALDLDALDAALSAHTAHGQPVALLGTSFAFVHADDGLGDRRFALPPGSRIMQTGGFKGRSREVAPDEMRSRLAWRYGVDDAMIIAEYGMTELSSQVYETTLRDAVTGRPTGPRRLRAPGWVRAVPVDPETLSPVEGDAIGILRVEDAANLDSCAVIQTSDLARRVGDGFEILGREADATPRGCSLAIDEALGGAG